MFKVAYGINGVGFGHTSRSKRVIDELLKLNPDIEIIIYSSFGSYNFLKDVYSHNERIKVREIWALDMKVINGRVSNILTIWSGIPQILNKINRTNELANQLLKEKINLVITDFEPYIPRAAVRAKIPFISINHQMFLRFGVIKLGEVPLPQLWSFVSTKFVARNFQPVSDVTIVTSFFTLPQKNFCGVAFVNPILRKVIINTNHRDDGFILVYPKTPNEDVLLKTIYSVQGYDFVVYLQNPKKYIKKYGKRKNIKIKPISNIEFVKDLQHCSFVFSNGGHQLASESLYLKKPILAIPEAAQFEQFYNAKMVESMGVGKNINVRKINSSVLIDFAKNLNKFKEQLKKHSITDGTNESMRIIKSKMDKTIL